MLRTLRIVPALVIVVGTACQEAVVVGNPPSIPQNLTYRLEPSGTPGEPAGIVLAWDDVPDAPDAELESYRVYSRGSTTQSFGLRGETTSNTFHDNGLPHLQYFVSAVDTDGDESGGSNVVDIAERTALEQPSDLWGISLDQAIHLSWIDNAFANDPDNRFDWYRVYSASYNRADDECDTNWALEGTTVAPEFLVGAIPNGVSRCYGVSAISREGYESPWSPVWQDTPRPDARNVLVFAFDDSAEASGFRFWEDDGDGMAEDAELGRVVDGNRTDIDFWIFRDLADSSLWLTPEFSGTSVRLYGDAPIADLTDIDLAPTTGYATSMIKAVPGWGYVFKMVELSGNTRYGALRVTHVGRRYLIFDWSFQTDLGNPELVVRAGLPTVTLSGTGVPSSK
jgi:hypothetical protein